MPAAKTSSLAALALVLAFGLVLERLPAQGRDEPEVLLSMTTTWHDLVFAVRDWLPLSKSVDVPDLKPGDRLRVVFRSDGRLAITAAEKGPEVLSLHARPLPLRRVLKEEAGVFFRLFRALWFAYFVLELRAEPRYVARSIQAVTAFPDQVETIQVTARRRPAIPGGHVIEAEILPRAGTWLAGVVAGVRPSLRGAHLLRTPNAAMSIAAAVEGPALPELIAPFAGMLANLRGRSKAERARFREFCQRRVAQLDGSFSLLIDGPGRYLRLAGVRNPAEFSHDAAGVVGSVFDTRRLGRPTIQVVDAVPEPLQGSPVRMVRHEEDFFETLTPAPERDDLATFTGVLADFSMKARLPADGVEVARLVERIQKGRLRRLPLLGEALVMAELQFGDRRLSRRPRSELLDNRLVQWFGAERLARFLETLPEQVELAVFKRNGRILIEAATR